MFLVEAKPQQLYCSQTLVGPQLAALAAGQEEDFSIAERYPLVATVKADNWPY